MVEAEEESLGQERQAFKLIIKNPSQSSPEDYVIEVSASATVLHVKERLAAEYEGNPQPQRQTLIYAGKVLKNDQEALQQVLRKVIDPDVKHTLHLVVKTPLDPTASSQQQAAQPSTTASQHFGSATAIPRPAFQGTAQGTATSSRFQPQTTTMQVGYASSGWQTPQPDPTILAAYHAALESLRSRPASSLVPPPVQGGPTRNASANAAQQLPVAGPGAFGTHPGFMPPFSLAPTLLVPPAMPQASSPPAAGPPGSSQEGVSASGESSTAGASTRTGPATNQPSPRLAQLYAPALAYVPVSLVQQSHQQQQPQQTPTRSAAIPGPSQTQQGGGAQPQAGPAPQQLFPYPQFGPVLPMMMPFGFNAYAAPGLPGQQPQHLHHVPNFVQPGHHPAPPQGFQGMPQHAQPAAPMRAGPPGLPQVRIRLIRINLKLLLQLCILALIVYQNTSHGRFLKLVGSAVALYFLWPIVNRNNAVQRQIRRFLHPQAREPPGPGPQAGATPPQQQAAANAAQQAPRGGFLRELQALLVGFFTSLLPGFNMNAEDAAAFAQAQRILAQEAAAEQQQRIAREHVD